MFAAADCHTHRQHLITTLHVNVLYIAIMYIMYTYYVVVGVSIITLR